MVPRLAFLAASIFSAYVALVFNLYNIQLVKGEDYLARAESRYAMTGQLTAERGLIYFTDKGGNHVPVVTNKKFPQVYAVPSTIEDYIETAHRLAEALKLPSDDLQKKLSKKSDGYKLLVKRADSRTIEAVKELNIKGVYAEEVPERFYAAGETASHVLGYVGPKSDEHGDRGFYGLEEFYNDTLIGKSGEVVDGSLVVATPGQDIYLTIDPNVQNEAERILESIVKTYKARGGSVIVEEVATGKILAISSLPTFDPNNYRLSDIKNFLNPVTQKIYEPGSVFKVITMAAGIDAGKITPDTKFFDNGVLNLNGKKIQNWDLKGHGMVTMTNVIESSLNTGAAFAQRETGNELFVEYLRKFGFAERTGIDLPGEVRGDLRAMNEKAPPIAFATASFGQGVAVTPIELINAVGAIANKGNLMRPYLNDALKPQMVKKVISEDSAKKVTAMMVSALDKAEVAKINGYSLAGKTGTAQVPDLKKGGYTDKVNNTYVGFGPASNPRFIILFKLDEPEGAPLAGQTVVPAFRDLAQFVLNYYNIPPDRIER